MQQLSIFVFLCHIIIFSYQAAQFLVGALGGVDTTQCVQETSWTKRRMCRDVLEREGGPSQDKRRKKINPEQRRDNKISKEYARDSSNDESDRRQQHEAMTSKLGALCDFQSNQLMLHLGRETQAKILYMVQSIYVLTQYHSNSINNQLHLTPCRFTDLWVSHPLFLVRRHR